MTDKVTVRALRPVGLSYPDGTGREVAIGETYVLSAGIAAMIGALAEAVGPAPANAPVPVGIPAPVLRVRGTP